MPVWVSNKLSYRKIYSVGWQQGKLSLSCNQFQFFHHVARKARTTLCIEKSMFRFPININTMSNLYLLHIYIYSIFIYIHLYSLLNTCTLIYGHTVTNTVAVTTLCNRVEPFHCKSPLIILPSFVSSFSFLVRLLHLWTNICQALSVTFLCSFPILLYFTTPSLCNASPFRSHYHYSPAQ